MRRRQRSGGRPTRGAHTNPRPATSTCRARNGSHRRRWSSPVISSTTVDASGTPGRSAWRRNRRAGAGKSSASAGSNTPATADGDAVSRRHAALRVGLIAASVEPLTSLPGL